VRLTATDFYFSESYAIKKGDYQDAAEWRAKAEKVREYQAQRDFRVLSVTTPGTSSFDGTKFGYAWHAAMLYGHEAFGWGEREFGASGTDQNTAPYHERPGLAPGYFTGGITVSGTSYERRTDAGTVFVDPTGHRAGSH
jgi:hypothetical protein